MSKIRTVLSRGQMRIVPIPWSPRRQKIDINRCKLPPNWSLDVANLAASSVFAAKTDNFLTTQRKSRSAFKTSFELGCIFVRPLRSFGSRCWNLREKGATTLSLWIVFCKRAHRPCRDLCREKKARPVDFGECSPLRHWVYLCTSVLSLLYYVIVCECSPLRCTCVLVY